MAARSCSKSPAAKRAKYHLLFNPKAWNRKVFDAMYNPSLLVDDSDELVVVTKDEFPKSRYHFLVIAREMILGIDDLTREHLELLKHMKKIGENMVKDVNDKLGNKKVNFRIGFHGVPSMKRLHMHVISQDFDSICLKTKKHWNSFTSDFFLEADHVIKEIEEKGYLYPDEEKFEALLKLPLKCHLCGKMPKNMPDLKSHLDHHNR